MKQRNKLAKIFSFLSRLVAGCASVMTKYRNEWISTKKSWMTTQWVWRVMLATKIWWL